MSAPPRRTPPAPAPLTVGVIGTGRVGTVLAAALAAAGHRLTAVTARSAASRTRVGDLLPGIPVRSNFDVARAATGLLLITVPDDALAPVVTDLADSGALSPGQVVAHTSGAHGTGILAPATDLGALPVAWHPAMTFTGHAADLDRLPGVSYGVTAPGPVRPLVTRLVADLGGTVEWVAEPDRPLYHAALAHGANHLVTLVNDAADRLRDAGVRDPGQVLRPLLTAALDNALRLGDAALTGPVARGDAGTVAGHLDVLKARAADSHEAYRALARRSADRAIASGTLDPEAAGRLLDVLAGVAAHRPRGGTGPPPAAGQPRGSR